MNNANIFFPVFALAAWTAIVLLLIPTARALAVRRGDVVVDDFRLGNRLQCRLRLACRTGTI